jgi:hypothetical protein
MLYLIAAMIGASVALVVYALASIAADADRRMIADATAETVEQVEPVQTWRKMIDALRDDVSCNPLAGSYDECGECAYRIVSGDDGVVCYGCEVADVCFLASSRVKTPTERYTTPEGCEVIPIGCAKKGKE